MHNVAYHRIERIAGSVITLRAEGVANQELAQVTSSFGTSLARVIRIDGDMVDSQVTSATSLPTEVNHFTP
jgi:V/A-type H+-transporting ATPase subunit B